MKLINLTAPSPQAPVLVDCPDLPTSRCAYVNPLAIVAIKSDLGGGTMIMLTSGQAVTTPHHPTAVYKAIFE